MTTQTLQQLTASFINKNGRRKDRRPAEPSWKPDIWDGPEFLPCHLLMEEEEEEEEEGSLCLPKAELNTKNETKRQLFNGRLVSFLVFNSITHIGKK